MDYFNEYDYMVADYLADLHVTVHVDYVGEKEDSFWQWDEWVVTITAPSRHPEKFIERSFKGCRDNAPVSEAEARKAGIIYTPCQINDEYFPLPPSAARVLFGLLADLDAAKMPYFEFCKDFGYFDDTEAGEKAWFEAQHNAIALQRLFTEQQIFYITKVLEDY